jgi:hypothetical protein
MIKVNGWLASTDIPAARKADVVILAAGGHSAWSGGDEKFKVRLHLLSYLLEGQIHYQRDLPRIMYSEHCRANTIRSCLLFQPEATFDGFRFY